MVLKIEHDASGKVTGVVYADESGAMQRQKARVVAVAGNSIESPRLLLNSASNMFPNGLANSSGQVGRNYMRHMTGSVYAVFEKSVHMYRGTTMAGIIRDEAKQRSQARLRRRLRDGDAVARPSVHGRVPQSRRVGTPLHRRRWSPIPAWPACGWSARTCRRKPTASRSMRKPRTSSACRWRACISTIIPTTSRCATTPTSRAPPSTRPSAPP